MDDILKDAKRLVKRIRDLDVMANDGPWDNRDGAGRPRLYICPVDRPIILGRFIGVHYGRPQTQALANAMFTVNARTLLPAMADILQEIIDAEIEFSVEMSDVALTAINEIAAKVMATSAT